MSAQRKPLLDLDTLVERPVVRIDGLDYELISPDEMTILQRQRQGVRGRRMQQLQEKDTLTEREQAELARLLDEACRELLKAPEEIHAKLQDGHRFLIIEAFTELSLRRRRAARAQEMPEKATGESSSRGSSGSTEAAH